MCADRSGLMEADSVTYPLFTSILLERMTFLVYVRHAVVKAVAAL